MVNSMYIFNFVRELCVHNYLLIVFYCCGLCIVYSKCLCMPIHVCKWIFLLLNCFADYLDEIKMKILHKYRP